MLLELALLFVAGVIGGIINSIAGGGSFITFPALWQLVFLLLWLTQQTHMLHVRVTLVEPSGSEKRS